MGLAARCAIAALGALAALGTTSCATARADRIWYPYLANASHIENLGGKVVIDPVSDWTYDAKGPVTQGYRETAVDPADIRGVWFLLEPQPGSTLAAHTLLVFELTDDRLLGVTIEARREADEDYSAWRGLWNAYELAYLWATPRDLLTRRVVLLGHETFVYPLAIDQAQARGLFQRLVERTEALETKPRFYNTLSSNCTNELAKAAGLKWNKSWVLTGTADEYLFRKGLVPGPSFAEANRRADVTAFVRELNGKELDDAGFDRALLAELRGRAAASVILSPR